MFDPNLAAVFNIHIRKSISCAVDPCRSIRGFNLEIRLYKSCNCDRQSQSVRPIGARGRLVDIDKLVRCVNTRPDKSTAELADMFYEYLTKKKENIIRYSGI